MPEQEAILKRLRELEQRASELDAEKRTNAAVIAELRSLLPTGSVTPQSRKPAQAVRELLQAHPHGLATTDIADQLQGVIETASSNPRRIIQNTMNQLKDSGAIKLTKRGDKTIARLA